MLSKKLSHIICQVHLCYCCLGQGGRRKATGHEGRETQYQTTTWYSRTPIPQRFRDASATVCVSNVVSLLVAMLVVLNVIGAVLGSLVALGGSTTGTTNALDSLHDARAHRNNAGVVLRYVVLTYELRYQCNKAAVCK
eukprot:scaffold768_cov166-Amphora_coffeaeformis.AAC.3